MTRTITGAACAFALAAALLVGGCAGPATFVAIEPPPDTTAEGVFDGPLPKVRVAVARAMADEGLTVLARESDPSRVVATKDQLPHVDENVLEPASGALPVYVLTADFAARPTETRVRLTVRVDHRGDRAAPYAWEYPSDLLGRVLEATRSRLHQRARRWSLPPRYRCPRPWRPPGRRP